MLPRRRVQLTLLDVGTAADRGTQQGTLPGCRKPSQPCASRWIPVRLQWATGTIRCQTVGKAIGHHPNDLARSGVAHQFGHPSFMWCVTLRYEETRPLSTNAFIVPVADIPKNLVDAGMKLSIGDFQRVSLFLRYFCHCKCDGFADFRKLLQGRRRWTCCRRLW